MVAQFIFLVNGGWQSSKATPLMVTVRPGDYQPFLDRGYTVFAVVTSSQPKFTIPEIVADVHRAVRFVRANAGAYGVRQDRLGILGSSWEGTSRFRLPRRDVRVGQIQTTLSNEKAAPCKRRPASFRQRTF